MFTSSLAYAPKTGYVEFPYFLKYEISFMWFLLAIIYTLTSSRMRLKKNKIEELYIYTVPAIIMAASIIVSIMINHLSGDYLSRSISNLICMFAILFGVYAAVTFFGNKAIDYTFYGLLLSTILNIIYTSYLYGFGNVISALLNIFSIVRFGYEDGSLMSNIGYSLEVSDATFAYGFYFIYYFCFCKKGKFRFRRLFLTTLGIYVGLKRIEVFAILLAMAVYYLFERRKVNIKKLQNVFFIIIMVISFVYIYVIKYHTEVFAFLDIHRVSLYSTIKSMFTISPLYIGKGYGYVNKWLSDVGATMWILSASHSEVVRMYIELGFCGFLLWIGYYTKLIPKYFLKKGNDRIGKIVLCMTVYIMTTYLIDNTLMLFATQFCFMLIPLAEGHGDVRHTHIVFNKRS